MRLLTLVLLLASTAACAQTQQARRDYTPEQMFRHYALSSCLSDAATGEQEKADAAASAAGYLELGEGPLEIYTEATELGRAFLKRTYTGKREGVAFNTMKCIDFVHSAEFEALVQTHFAAKK